MKRILGAMGLALALSLAGCQGDEGDRGAPADGTTGGGGGGGASPMPSPGDADDMMTPDYAPTRAPGGMGGTGGR